MHGRFCTYLLLLFCFPPTHPNTHTSYQTTHPPRRYLGREYGLIGRNAAEMHQVDLLQDELQVCGLSPTHPPTLPSSTHPPTLS